MPRLERPTGGPFTQRSCANECPLEFVKSDLTHSANCYYLIVGNTGRGRSDKRPYVDRKTIATTMLIAGIMLGAFTVQLKDQISLHLGTLGFNSIMQCAATGL